jgi:hypothetical protein
MIPSVDAALRSYVTTFLDAAGMDGIATRLRFCCPDKISYVHACTILKCAGMRANKPWGHIIEIAAFWIEAAVNSAIEGRVKESENHIKYMQKLCERELTAFAPN